MKGLRILASALVLVPSAGLAAPGLDEEVYGATIETGKTELEARYGRLVGGSADGEDALVIEAARGFSSHFYGAALAKFARNRDDNRRLETVGLEGIFTLGDIQGLGMNAALYVEAEHNLHGPDNLETKLLLEHRKGPFDTRLNLIAERELTSGAPIEFGYAASADYEVAEDLSIGAQAFGGLGTSRNITTRDEHFVGPSAKVGFDHFGSGELEIRAGYLFAVGRASAVTHGQIHFGVEYEF
jgi:hypothetical protein